MYSQKMVAAYTPSMKLLRTKGRFFLWGGILTIEWQWLQTIAPLGISSLQKGQTVTLRALGDSDSIFFIGRPQLS
jgi:hypothetical protein